MSRIWTGPTWEDLVANVAVEAITLAAFAWFGALAGSFLNVVVYRLPLGKNLLWPPSACPQCGTRLGWRENLPIFGYLRLRGKCKHCGTPIDRAYFHAEILVALSTIFILLSFVRGGGENLPFREAEFYKGFLYTIWYPKFNLLIISCWFLVLFYMTFCVCFWSLRGQKVPGIFWVFATAWVALPPVWYPWLIQVPLAGGISDGKWGGLESPWEALSSVGAGFVAGWGLGWAHRLAIVFFGQGKLIDPNLAWLLAIWGAMTGWQTIAAIAWLCFLVLLIFPGRFDPTWLVWFLGAIVLALWRPLAQWLPLWLEPNLALALGFMAICLSFAFLAGWRRATGRLTSEKTSDHTEKP